MVWLLHNKFDYDPKVRKLEANLQRVGVEYYRCSVVPFSDDGIIFDRDDINVDMLRDKPVFVYGSYTLAQMSGLSMVEPIELYTNLSKFGAGSSTTRYRHNFRYCIKPH